MKALIVSDNHANVSILEELIAIYANEIDLWLHCGDSEFSADDPIWNVFKTVLGNMDIDYSLPFNRVEQFGEENLLIVHGHHHSVRLTLDYLNDLAQENDADVVFYGHTHIAQVDQIGNRYFINPGSIVQPRGALRKGSYAIYEKNEDGRFIRFYDWNHNEISELSRKLA